MPLASPSTSKTVLATALVVAMLLSGLALYANISVRLSDHHPDWPLFRPLAPMSVTVAAVLWSFWLGVLVAPRWAGIGLPARFLSIGSWATATAAGALFLAGL